MNSSIENFSKKFAFRDALFRSISVIGATFTISVISILPGFGVKGLVIASSIQLILSSLLELPTSILADKIGRSIILRISLFLKIIVSVALGFAIYFASKNMINYVWYAFFFEAFIDAIASTLMSGSYQISYLSLYSEMYSKNDKPPLFLHIFKYAIKFRYYFPIVFVFTVISTFSIASFYSTNLYTCAYAILFIIVLSRIWLFSLVCFDFWRFKLLNDKTSSKVLEGISQISNSIKEKKHIFTIYSITFLFNLIGIFYLSGQLMKTLSAFTLDHNKLWVYAILSCVVVYLIRTTINILILPKVTREKLLANQTIISLAILFSSAAIFGVNKVSSDPIVLYTIFFTSNVIIYSVADILSKTIESSIAEISKTGFKATWISLGNTVAYLIFGATSVLLSLIHIDYSNIVIAFILFGCGVYLFFVSMSIDQNQKSIPSFELVLQKQILKGVSIIIGLIFLIDMCSSMLITRSRIDEAKNKISSAVLIGIKSHVLQGNIIEINNFLYSLRSSGLIQCYSLDIFSKEINNCEKLEKDNKYLQKEIIKINYDNVEYGTIYYSIDVSIYSRFMLFRFLIDILVSCLLFIIFYKILFKVSRSLSEEVKILSSGLDTNETADGFFKIKEFQTIYSELKSVIQMRENLNIQGLQSKISKQVAHDIRSPLSALNMALYGLASIPEDRRILIRNAVQRINDIANDLLHKSKVIAISNSTARSISIEQLSPIVDALVSEKRIQFRDKLNIDISLDLSYSYGLFANINSNELKRVLSNLINNSVESVGLNKKIVIMVSVFSKDNKNVIQISDNGSGIPENILSKLGIEQISFGKQDSNVGNGLGIHHAKQTIESYNGLLKIQSAIGVGTELQIYFPQAEIPDWFVECIQVKSNTSFITFDDDISIHQIWSERLLLINKDFNVNHHIFTNQENFKNEALSFLNKNCIYLVDFEFLSESKSGLDLIEELSLFDKRIIGRTMLVTSRFDEKNIRERCLRLGIKIIPKAMAAYIPFQLIE